MPRSEAVLASRRRAAMDIFYCSNKTLFEQKLVSIEAPVNPGLGCARGMQLQ